MKHKRTAQDVAAMFNDPSLHRRPVKTPDGQEFVILYSEPIDVLHARLCESLRTWPKSLPRKRARP